MQEYATSTVSYGLLFECPPDILKQSVELARCDYWPRYDVKLTTMQSCNKVLVLLFTNNVLKLLGKSIPTPNISEFYANWRAKDVLANDVFCIGMDNILDNYSQIGLFKFTLSGRIREYRAIRLTLNNPGLSRGSRTVADDWKL
jgi:hypothetical protein